MGFLAKVRHPDIVQELRFVLTSSVDGRPELTFLGSAFLSPTLEDMNSAFCPSPLLPVKEISEQELSVASPRTRVPFEECNPSQITIATPALATDITSDKSILTRLQQRRPQHIPIPSSVLTFNTTSHSSVANDIASGFNPASSKSTTPRTFNLDVLVVDDDPLTRLLMTRLLTRLGCTVSVAENGKAALEIMLACTLQSRRPSPSVSSQASEPLDFVAMQGSEREFDPLKGRRFAVCFMDNQMPVSSSHSTTL